MCVVETNRLVQIGGRSLFVLNIPTSAKCEPRTICTPGAKTNEAEGISTYQRQYQHIHGIANSQKQFFRAHTPCSLLLLLLWLLFVAAGNSPTRTCIRVSLRRGK